MAIGVPLLYYLILPKIDAGWATTGRGPGKHQTGIPLLGWLTTFGPPRSPRSRAGGPVRPLTASGC